MIKIYYKYTVPSNVLSECYEDIADIAQFWVHCSCKNYFQEYYRAENKFGNKYMQIIYKSMRDLRFQVSSDRLMTMYHFQYRVLSIFSNFYVWSRPP